MTDKQDEIASRILKEFQELRDDVSDLKADMIEDLKEIKFRLHMIELTGEPLSARLDRMNDLLKGASGLRPDRALLVRLRQGFGGSPSRQEAVSAIR
jgi:hypothetical protein